MNAVLTVSEQLENDEGENDWEQKQEGQVCACLLGWVENQSACWMPTQPEPDGERVVGEDKVEWDNAENSWQNALTIDGYCAFLYVWGLLCSKVKVRA